MSKTDRVSETGSRARRIAALPCGRRTKYLVVVFWIVHSPHRIAGGQAAGRGKERRLVLPSGQCRLDPGTEPAGQVYLEEPQPGRADLPAAIRDHPRRPEQGRRRRTPVRGHPRCRRPGGRPDPGARPPGDRDRCRLGPRLHRQHREIRQRPEGNRVRRRSRGIGLRHRTGRQRGGRAEDLQGHRYHAAVRDPGGGHRAAPADLPEPGPVAAADPVRRRRAHRGRGGHLPADAACEPDRQRAERRDPRGARARRGDRLRAAALFLPERASRSPSSATRTRPPRCGPPWRVLRVSRR